MKIFRCEEILFKILAGLKGKNLVESFRKEICLEKKRQNDNRTAKMKIF
jgi:hypothetical protein